MRRLYKPEKGNVPALEGCNCEVGTFAVRGNGFHALWKHLDRQMVWVLKERDHRPMMSD